MDPQLSSAIVDAQKVQAVQGVTNPLCHPQLGTSNGSRLRESYS
jgi:hypothetical protein